MKKLKALMLGYSLFLLTVNGASGAQPLGALELTTEFANSPLGVDQLQPRLGWKLQSDQRAQVQQAYRVLVASTPALLAADRGDLWDSGKVVSDQTLEVLYRGAALQSATRYFWKVQVWDAQQSSHENSWSSPTYFETGLLQPADWKGQWIGWGPKRDIQPISLSDAHWIWAGGKTARTKAPEGSCWFRKSVIIPEGKTLAEALFAGSADDRFVLYVNGTEVGGNKGWNKPLFVSLNDCLHPGVNSIAVRASNDAPSPAGFIGKLQVTWTDKSILSVPTDESWKVIGKELKEWRRENFDDSSWPRAEVIAAPGDSPWGHLTLPAVTVLAPQSAPLLRKEFVLDRPVASARLYICGLGLYELHLNGRRVGDSVLDPAHTQYNKRVLYATYDVTNQLHAGANGLGVELGHGFYSLREQTPWQWHEAPWNSPPKLLCQLNVRYLDGTTATIVSDGSWQLSIDGPTRSDSIYWGEHYDARKEKTGWDQPGYSNAGFVNAAVVAAPDGQLSSQTLPPMRVIETRKAVSVKNPKPGSYVFDVGLVTTGWIRLSASCPAGTRVTLHYSERLAGDGTASLFHLKNEDPCQTDSYTFKGDGLESFEPKFSYKGFKYVEVTDCPVALTLENVAIQVVHSDVQTTGTFECSNPDFNRLHDNMVRTLLNNFHGKPTDTPTYEKNGWTGDANFAMNCMFYNFDMTTFMTKWMEDCRDSINAEGNVPVIVPAGIWGYSWHPVWSSVYVYGLKALEQYAGSAKPMENHFEILQKYTQYNLSQLIDGIATRRINKGQGVMCDHLAPGLETRSTGQAPPEGGALGSTAYLYGTLQIMAEKAAALGQNDLAGRYREEAGKLLVAFNTHFLDPQTGIYHTDILEIPDMKDSKKMVPVGYRQTSNLIALAFQMVPETMHAAVVQHLVEDIVARDYHLDTGSAGTRHILPVLTENGHGDVAYKVATQSTYPSWGNQLALGATTMWECWRTPRSNDHYFMGTIDDWFYQHLAGIRSESEGFKVMTIKPYPLKELTYARASLKTARGLVASGWSREPDGTLKLEVTIPVNTTASVYVPAESAESVREGECRASEAAGVAYLRQEKDYVVYRVASGQYCFRVAKAQRN